MKMNENYAKSKEEQQIKKKKNVKEKHTKKILI